MSVASYAQRLKRGTASLLESPHYRDLIVNQKDRKLRNNYFGVKEWYLMTRMEMEKVSTQGRETVVSEISKNNEEYPAGYPFVSVAKGEKEMEEQKAKWEEFRHLSATLYPTSPYAIEERVMDEWNHFCDGKESVSETPKLHYHGGVAIKMYNEYQRQQPEMLERQPEYSDKAFQLYSELHKNCNPWKSANSIESTFLDKFLNSVESRADARDLLPAVLLRWRWLSSGAQLKYQTPNAEQTEEIIGKLCDLQEASTAVNLLRHKLAFKLSPQSRQTFERVIHSLLLQHIQQSEDPTQMQSPAKPETEEPKDSLTVTGGKRRWPRNKYPFRQTPRYYFYKSLPVVLNPEPSVFGEYPLPRLPRDNDTKRLLPDDQRKRLQIMIRDQERLEEWTAGQTAESPALQTLTDMYRVYHYMTAPGWRYYGGFEPTSLSTDCLVLAGSIGGTEEGWQRSREIGESILSSAAGNESQLSDSGLCGLLLGSCLNPDTALGVQDLLSDKMINAVGKDTLGLGGFIPTLTLMRHASHPVPERFNKNIPESPLAKAVEKRVKQLSEKAN